MQQALEYTHEKVISKIQKAVHDHTQKKGLAFLIEFILC